MGPRICPGICTGMTFPRLIKIAVQTIFLTGEFSNSVYLVKEIKGRVGAAFDISVVGPSDALTDIARGAVRAGVLQAHGRRPLADPVTPPMVRPSAYDDDAQAEDFDDAGFFEED